MVLGKLPVPGRPTILMIVGQEPISLAVGAGGGCLDIITLLYSFSPLSSSLLETGRYRLKTPKQPICCLVAYFSRSVYHYGLHIITDKPTHKQTHAAKTIFINGMQQITFSCANITLTADQ